MHGAENTLIMLWPVPILGLAVVFVLLMQSPCIAAPPELRGTWLTTTANTAIASPAQTADTMRRLREIGLNTVYLECWKNGYTEFPSQTMNRLIGVPMRINPSIKGQPAIQRDLLAESLIEAHRNQLLLVAWFEYGFMAAHKDTHNELRARRDWLSLHREGGDVAKNGFVWLNPLHPDAQQLLIDIVVEAIHRYDLDGIQIDDRIVWPSLEMGYDEFTRQLYAAEHDGRQPPDDFRDPHWMRWRQEKVEQFSRRFVAEVRKANPNLIISLSPGPHPWALENYLIDWPAWSRWPEHEPRWDEFVPQVYRMNYARFEQDWLEQVQHIGPRRRDLVAGIRIVGDGPDLSWQHLRQSIELVRTTGAGGHCHWFSRGVLEIYPDQLQQFYDVQQLGHAPHPHRPADWRPPPIIAHKTADTWTAHLPPGRHRVIARIADQWHETAHVTGPGPVTLDLPADTEAVELLRDRRE
jgi:uncharacterized lipoprotein YddW (UPF0748 family)